MGETLTHRLANRNIISIANRTRWLAITLAVLLAVSQLGIVAAGGAGMIVGP